MANSGYKSVYRINRHKKGIHGWYVRVAFKGEIYAKHFSDSQYGGKRKALKYALDWRNETERELGKPRTDRTVVAVSQRNQTGVIGVRRTLKAMTRDGRKLGPVYEVHWRPTPNEMRRTSVSITKYGEKEAFRRACEIRKAKERELFGGELPPLKRKRRRLTRG